MTRRRLEPAERRRELLDAAVAEFRENGVANTSVSDIVKRAGAAQGTFYLYFETKDDLICAVVGETLDEVAARLESAVNMPGANPLQKMLVLRDALLEASDEPHETEMSAYIHLPENRALHDRATEEFGPRIAPVLGRIIAEGCEAGIFDVEHAELAAWFVLGAFQAYEQSQPDAGEMPHTLDHLTQFALRGLGYTGEMPALEG